MRRFILVLLIWILSSTPFFARGSSGTAHRSSTYHASSSIHSSSKTTHHSKRASGIARDSRGRIKRDPRARQAFVKSHPCPSTGKTRGACPGYVVDHIKPLKRGGADAPSNMQWQTTAAAKAKDKWE